jgi:3-hydroxyisobutyrate dehydrogenase
MSVSVGFIGLGTMGEPMALRLVRAGTPLTIWNRTASKCGALVDAGAGVARNAADVFARCRAVILMLADVAAIEAVLDGSEVAGRTIINMATIAPSDSKALGERIRAAGGHYVEAPVSGSRKPAEAGQLVAMLAGEPDQVEEARPLLAPMCKSVFACGPVPSALYMKLAVNLYLITMVTGLVESLHFAQRHDLDLARFIAILDAGPMASDVSRVKLAKLAAQDFSVQAAISNVLDNNRLVAEAARAAGIASPLLDVCHSLYGETLALGHGNEDMVAVLRAIEQRTDQGLGARGTRPIR